MEPTIDDQRESIKLAVSESTGAEMHAPPEQPRECTEEDTSPAEEIDDQQPVQSKTDLYRAVRKLIICILGAAIPFGIMAGVEAFVPAPPPGPAYSSAMSVIVAIFLVGIGFSIASAFMLWRVLSLCLPRMPATLANIVLGFINLTLFALVRTNWGNSLGYLYFGLVLLVTPPSALMLFRMLRAAQTNTSGIQNLAINDHLTEQSERTPALVHDLLHSARPVRDCGADWALMRQLAPACRKCYRCDSIVFHAENLATDDVNVLLKARSQRVAANQPAATQRRPDGTYMLGSCSATGSYRLPTPLFVLPFSLSGLALLMAPGHIGPFLNHPLAQMAFALASLWHLLGCWLLTRTANVGIRAVIFVVFSIPLLLTPMLGPAVITIMQALGPIH